MQLLDGSIRETPHDQQPVSAWWNPKRDLESSFDLIKSSWLNLLLLACPLAIASEALHWSATTIFMLVRSSDNLTPTLTILFFILHHSANMMCTAQCLLTNWH